MPSSRTRYTRSTPTPPLDLTGDELVDAWRGVKAEEEEEVTGGLAGLLRSRSRALLGRPRAPAPPRGARRRRVLIAISTAAPARGAVADPAGHRQGHPAAARRAAAAPSARSSPSCVGVLVATVDRRGDVQRVPAPPRPGRPGRRARHPPPAVRALPAAQHRVPRALHVGPGDLAPDLRRRGDRRPARRRHHQPHHLAAAHGRHRRSPCCSSTCGSRW